MEEQIEETHFLGKVFEACKQPAILVGQSASQPVSRQSSKSTRLYGHRVNRYIKHYFGGEAFLSSLTNKHTDSGLVDMAMPS